MKKPMDVSLAIEKLLPAASYNGSLTANTETAYSCLRWKDERKKPTWEELQNAWALIEINKETEEERLVIEAKIQAEIRKIAIERLKEKGEIRVEYK